MVALVTLILSFLILPSCQSVSCTDSIIFYSASLNSINLIPAFTSITCPSTYLYLTDGNFTLSTASTINLNIIASTYLEIQPLYCEAGQTSKCYKLGTRPTIFLTDSIVTFIVSKNTIFKNINFSQKFQFISNCQICDYCRAITSSNSFFYNDRNELIGDDQFLNQSICDRYTSLDFISVLNTGSLSLNVIIKQNVSFKDFRMQFASLIFIDLGKVALSNVDFYNIVVKKSVILSQSNVDKYAANFEYIGGGIELLNNGYELNYVLGSSTFIRLVNYFSVFIENLNIKNNIGIDENYLIDFRNIYELNLLNNNFSYNLFESHIISIDQRRISSFSSFDLSEYNSKVEIYMNIFKNNYAENLINFEFNLQTQSILIDKSEFFNNSAEVAIFFTSNFQSIFEPMVNFELFKINRTDFEFNSIISLITIYSVPVLLMQSLLIQGNGIDLDVNSEILDVIIAEDASYLQYNRNFNSRQVGSLIYLSISFNTWLFGSQFYYNFGQLAYIKLSFQVYFEYLDLENNSIDEVSFIEAEDFSQLTVYKVFSQSNIVLKKDAYLMAFNGDNTDNNISIKDLNLSDGNIGVYVSFNGVIQLENIFMGDSKATSLPLLNINIEKSSLLNLKNSVFLNNKNDVVHMNPALGQVYLSFIIENTNFTGCEAESKLINIGSQLLLRNETQNLIKNCEFINNTGNIITIESSFDEIYFENCLFEGNTATDSGIISGLTTTTINFTNTKFSQNSNIILNFNLNTNKIITVECVFIDNFGIMVQSIISNYYDYGSVYKNNQGLILKIQFKGSALLSSSMIVSNTLTSANSLIEILSESKLVMSNVTVFNNTSAKKSILMIENDSGANISDSVFESNSAIRGSAILLQLCLSNRVNLTNVHFLNNNAKLSGTIFVLEGYLTVENCEFSSNKATYSAGIDAIYSSIVYIFNTRFHNQEGEGSCIKSQDSSQISIFNSEFKNFDTNLYGTLIEVKDSELTFENCQFENVEFLEGILISGENS